MLGICRRWGGRWSGRNWGEEEGGGAEWVCRCWAPKLRAVRQGRILIDNSKTWVYLSNPSRLKTCLPSSAGAREPYSTEFLRCIIQWCGFISKVYPIVLKRMALLGFFFDRWFYYYIFYVFGNCLKHKLREAVCKYFKQINNTIKGSRSRSLMAFLFLTC